MGPLLDSSAVVHTLGLGCLLVKGNPATLSCKALLKDTADLSGHTFGRILTAAPAHYVLGHELCDGKLLIHLIWMGTEKEVLMLLLLENVPQ